MSTCTSSSILLTNVYQEILVICMSKVNQNLLKSAPKFILYIHLLNIVLKIMHLYHCMVLSSFPISSMSSLMLLSLYIDTCLSKVFLEY